MAKYRNNLSRISQLSCAVTFFTRKLSLPGGPLPVFSAFFVVMQQEPEKKKGCLTRLPWKRSRLDLFSLEQKGFFCYSRVYYFLSMKSSFQIGILCTVFCLGSTFFSSAVQTVNIGSTFSCTFLDSGEKGFFDSSSTHTWTSDQIDSAIRALNTWNTLINSTPGRTLNVGLTWYDGADSSTLASAYSPDG